MTTTEQRAEWTRIAEQAIDARPTDQDLGELVEAVPMLLADLDQAERVLTLVAEHIKGEMARGYVLTYEPAAGDKWRERWNNLLGEVEYVIAAKEK
jgi:hypothetical protein